MYKEFISVMYIDKNPVTVQKCTHIIAAWAAFYQYLTALSMHTVSVRELSVNKVLRYIILRVCKADFITICVVYTLHPKNITLSMLLCFVWAWINRI